MEPTPTIEQLTRRLRGRLEEKVKRGVDVSDLKQLSRVGPEMERMLKIRGYDTLWDIAHADINQLPDDAMVSIRTTERMIDEVRKLLLWYLLVYPFQCPFLKWLEDFDPYVEEALLFVDIDDTDLLSLLDKICSIYLERLEYEQCLRGFAV